MNPHLRRALQDLALVAGGAIPGALLRWQLQLLSRTGSPQLGAFTGAHLVANLLGCLLIGVLLAQPSRRARLYLWGGIGFCGSLTTFSSWMLELVGRLEAGEPLQAIAVLLFSLLGGLGLVQLGHWAGRAVRRP